MRVTPTGPAFLGLFFLSTLVFVQSPSRALGLVPVLDRNGNGRFDQDDDPVQWESRARLLQQVVTETGALDLYLADDGAVVIVVPASGSSTFRVSDGTALGFEIRQSTSSLEPRDVAEIKAAADELVWSWRGESVGTSSYFDHSLGKVAIRNVDPGVMQYFDREFPGKTIYVGSTGTFASRYADYEVHWGGAQMVGDVLPLPDSGYDCTSGFSVWNVNHYPRMTTAGHCFADNEIVRSPGGTSFGHVTKRDFSTVTDIDSEIVGNVNYIEMGPSIYRDVSPGYDAVLEASDPAKLVGYCVSGATRYEQCGQYVYYLDYKFCGTPTFCIEHEILTQGPGICKGDSGGPLYKDLVGGVGIRGTVSGFEPDEATGGCTGSDHHGGWDPGFNAFMKWSRIRDSMNVTIMVAP